MTISAFAAGICVASGGIHALSVGLAIPRCRRRSQPTPPPKEVPPVSIVQPLKGVETFSRETLRSIFLLDYPDYEIVFCLASADDPIVPADAFTEEAAALKGLVQLRYLQNSGHDGFLTEPQIWQDLAATQRTAGR